MPLPPSPVVLECPACHWSQLVAPKSDCLIDKMYTVTDCPKCGHKDITRRVPSVVEMLTGRFKSLFDKV